MQDLNLDVNLPANALLVLSFPNAECSNGGDGNMGTAHSNSAQGEYRRLSVSFIFDKVFEKKLLCCIAPSLVSLINWSRQL